MGPNGEPRGSPLPRRIAVAIEDLLARRGSLSAAEISQGLTAKGIIGISRGSIDLFLVRHPRAAATGGRWRLRAAEARPARPKSARSHEVSPGTRPGQRDRTPSGYAAADGRIAGAAKQQTASPSAALGADASLMDHVKVVFASHRYLSTSEIITAVQALSRDRVSGAEVRRELNSSSRVRRAGPERWEWNDTADRIYLAALARTRDNQDSAPRGRAQKPGMAAPTRRQTATNRHDPFLDAVRILVSPAAINGFTCAYCRSPFINGACGCLVAP